MNRSEQINDLAAALAKAQAGITAAKAGAENPHFKSKYATLADVWDACRKQLSSNGIAVTQLPSTEETGLTVTTILAHSSGQWISSQLTVPLESRGVGAHQIGSALTYARRYALAAMVGVAPEDDDDGNAAQSAMPEKRKSRRQSQKPKPEDEALERLRVFTWGRMKAYEAKEGMTTTEILIEAGIPEDIMTGERKANVNELQCLGKWLDMKEQGADELPKWAGGEADDVPPDSEGVPA
jgi:hypothetical protein